MSVKYIYRCKCGKCGNEFEVESIKPIICPKCSNSSRSNKVCLVVEEP